MHFVAKLIFILLFYPCISMTTQRSSSTVLPLLSKLNSSFKIVLASGSPRRKELLSLVGLPNFTVLTSNFAEDFEKADFPTPQQYCLATANKKVEQVALSLGNLPDKTLVIGADTIVEIDGMVLEKPEHDSDSRRMLSLLSNRDHYVHTAVVAYSNSWELSGQLQNTLLEMKPMFSFVETTRVTFAELTEEDISAYIELGEGKDKAGSYGIQGVGGQFVKSITGCYFNVMGLPVHALSSKLASTFSEN